MKYILLLALCLFLTQGNLSAQTPAAKPANRPVQALAAKPAAKVKELPTGDVTPEKVEQFCEMIRTSAEKDLEDYSKISYAKYNSYRKTLNSWMNYSFLELDSNIEIQWFNKMLEYLNFYYNTKKEHDLSVAKEDSEQKVTNKKRFDAGVNNFKKFLEKDPPKPKAERLEVLKRQKQEYERAKRIKEKTQGKAKGGEGGKQKLFDE